jgi:hypothetical protein
MFLPGVLSAVIHSERVREIDRVSRERRLLQRDSTELPAAVARSEARSSAAATVALARRRRRAGTPCESA